MKVRRRASNSLSAKIRSGKGIPQQGFVSATGATAPERRYPGTRLGVEEVIRQSFTEAKIYQAEWKEYNEKVAKR